MKWERLSFSPCAGSKSSKLTPKEQHKIYGCFSLKAAFAIMIKASLNGKSWHGPLQRLLFKFSYYYPSRICVTSNNPAILCFLGICSVLASPYPFPWQQSVFSVFFLYPAPFSIQKRYFCTACCLKTHKKNTRSPLLGTNGRETGRGFQKWLKTHIEHWIHYIISRQMSTTKNPRISGSLDDV